MGGAHSRVSILQVTRCAWLEVGSSDCVPCLKKEIRLFVVAVEGYQFDSIQGLQKLDLT
jgi:hypothetical protein